MEIAEIINNRDECLKCVGTIETLRNGMDMLENVLNDTMIISEYEDSIVVGSNALYDLEEALGEKIELYDQMLRYDHGLMED